MTEKARMVKPEEMAGEGGPGWIERRWRLGLLCAWLVLALLLVIPKLTAIAGLGLRDTDDNLRLAQVRAWLAGQPWFDLTQYRLAPPGGADIHWSRLPDLPIAGLILLFKPMFGTAAAEQWAAGLAPLIPLGIGLVGIALVARRLIAPAAWPAALLVMMGGLLLLPMWAPLRIDHHGWQLALLAIAWSGLVDPDVRRGGVVAGLASALSLSIGLEMLAFLALIGAATTLLWVRDGRHARIAGYGAAIGGGTAIGFLLFASWANRAPVCDALSPVWMSAMIAAGALLVALALLAPATAKRRLAGAAIAGVILAIGFALAWPHCLGRPEGVSPELQRIWLDHVREAKPVFVQKWRGILVIVSLPLSGLIGYGFAIRHYWADPRRDLWIASAAMAAAGAAMLFFQVRVAPATQLMSIAGGAFIAWRLVPRWRSSPVVPVRIIGTLAALSLATGLYVLVPLQMIPKPPDEKRTSARCMARATLAPLARAPAGTILAPVDLGPRLIVTTPHAAVAGPYHRNGAAILDVFHAFQRGDAFARDVIRRRHVDYVLICKGLQGSGLYEGDGDGLFDRLDRGETPDWLAPIPQPRGSPLRFYRVR